MNLNNGFLLSSKGFMMTAFVGFIMIAGMVVSREASAATSSSNATAFFDSKGNLVGEKVLTCDNKFFQGGVTTEYALYVTYDCWSAEKEILGDLPPGMTQAQACATVGGNWCANGAVPPVYNWQ